MSIESCKHFTSIEGSIFPSRVHCKVFELLYLPDDRKLHLTEFNIKIFLSRARILPSVAMTVGSKGAMGQNSPATITSNVPIYLMSILTLQVVLRKVAIVDNCDIIDNFSNINYTKRNVA